MFVESGEFDGALEVQTPAQMWKEYHEAEKQAAFEDELMQEEFEDELFGGSTDEFDADWIFKKRKEDQAAEMNQVDMVHPVQIRRMMMLRMMMVRMTTLRILILRMMMLRRVQ